MMKYYLAIDIGTTNWKATVFDEIGRLQAIERTPTKTHTDQSGNHFYVAEEIWNDVQLLCKKVTAKVGQPISAVSVTSFGEAVVAVDKDGNTLGDIVAWFDTRSMKQAQQMKEHFGEERLYEITGLDVNPIFSLPKILWMRDNKPEIYDKAFKWLQMTDYILFCLTGEFVTDYTLASRTLALDILQNQWSMEILQGVGVPREMLPCIEESGTVIGKISADIEKKTGITQGAKVAVGGNDHSCGSIAAGVIHGDKIFDSSGTAESFIYISKKNAVPKMKFAGQRTCRYLQKDRYALWGGIISSGRSFDWAYEMFTSSKCFGIGQEHYSYDKVLDQVMDEQGMESGLIFYPHLRGAGAPYWNPKISGSFLGLRDVHSAKNMMRSVLEGLSMQARMIVEMEQSLAGVDVQSLCVVGGSSRNSQWQTIKASVTKKDIEICPEAEATALGTAMLAAIGDGMYRDIEQASDMLATHNTVIHPNEEMAKRYDQLYELYCEGYKHLKKFNEQIYEVTRK